MSSMTEAIAPNSSNLFTNPSVSPIQVTIRVMYSLRNSTTSSGASFSEMAVNDRMLDWLYQQTRNEVQNMANKLGVISTFREQQVYKLSLIHI